MYPWGDTPKTDTPSWTVGDTIYSGDCAGTIVSVDAETFTLGVVWSDGDGGPITYPIDATYLRKKMPWE